MFKRLRFALILFLAVPAICLMGCGSDDDDDSSTSTTTNGAAAADSSAPTLTGSWDGEFGTSAEFALSIVQNGDALTGGYTSSAGSPGTLTGNIDGDDVEFTTTVVDTNGNVTAQWNGSANGARDSMSGTFTITAGGGGNGTWSASKN